MAKLSVRVQPGASRDEIVVEEESLRVRLAAPAVEGKANQRLIRLLARKLKMRQADLAIIYGQASRQKLIEVAGLTDAEARARLLSD